jgi:hypothetical protein
MSDIKIEDNFIEQEKFDELQTLMMGDGFVWCYGDGIDYGKELNKFQFTHVFYSAPAPRSEYFENLAPIFEILQPISILRIKANLLTRTPNIVENSFHVDFGDVIKDEKQKQWATSIFYMNTNNGYTKFEDGTKVESVANRMVTFPSNMKHTGTSCTDEKIRVVINFNYFER